MHDLAEPVAEQPYRNPHTRRPCKYDFRMVAFARRLRGFGFQYKEIADECGHRFGVRPSLFTVRSWTDQHSRVLG